MTDTTDIVGISLTLNGPIKPNHVMKFHNPAGAVVGTLDFNGPAMTFVGNAQESAKMFFHVFVAEYLAERLKDERAAEREACATLIENYHDDDWTVLMQYECAEAIRARGTP